MGSGLEFRAKQMLVFRLAEPGCYVSPGTNKTRNPIAANCKRTSRKLWTYHFAIAQLFLMIYLTQPNVVIFKSLQMFDYPVENQSFPVCSRMS